MKHITAITLLVSGLWINPVNAQSHAPDRLRLLRLTGMLVPYETQAQDAATTSRTVPISVSNNQWLFRISEAEGLAKSVEVVPATKDAPLLKDVRFTGPEALMRRLQKADQPGRVLTFEGLFDAKDRTFRITAVDEEQDTLLPSQ
jgi:hypothetical protein